VFTEWHGLRVWAPAVEHSIDVLGNVSSLLNSAPEE